MTEELVAEQQPQEAAPSLPAVSGATLDVALVQGSTPMALLARALDRGADIGILEKLMDLQERYEKNEARKAFDAAVANAKATLPAVKKNRTGHNNKRYADLAAFARAADPVLAANGLSYRYRTSQNGSINVTCILAHRDGHCEETTLSGAADTSGSKNNIQAIGSTLTYLQRYSLCAILGLAATEDDDGAAGGGDEPITEDQATAIREKIQATGADIEKLCVYFKVEAVPDLRKKDFDRVMVALDQRKAKRAKP